MTGEGSARAMAWQFRQRPLSHVAFAAGLIVCAAPFALAGEASYCVTCTNPDQTYVCRVTAGGSKPSDALASPVAQMSTSRWSTSSFC